MQTTTRRIFLVGYAAAALTWAGITLNVGNASGADMTVVVPALLFSGLGLIHACWMMGWRRAMAFFALCILISLCLEQYAIWTGKAGRPYYYTDVLGPKLLDVPLLIPLAWFQMIYPTYVIANLIVGGRMCFRTSGLAMLMWLSVVAALLETAWDLSLDPYMVYHAKAWVWQDITPTEEYFGIPFLNYVGWVKISLYVNVLFRLLERKVPLRPMGDMPKWILAFPLFVYFMSGLVDVLTDVPEATAVRLLPVFVMGLPLLLALSRFMEASVLVADEDIQPEPEAVTP